jgi:hypothetical protein
LIFNGQYDSNTSVDTIFEVKSGGEFAIRYNASTTNCGTAIDASNGGNVTINRSTVDATDYSAKIGGNCVLNAATGQNITLSKPVKIASGKYLTVNSTPTSTITVEYDGTVTVGTTVIAKAKSPVASSFSYVGNSYGFENVLDENTGLYNIILTNYNQ